MQPIYLAIGVFDGVHRGHQALIAATQNAAQKDPAQTGVLTFWPHPSHLLAPDNAVLSLMPLDVKTEVLRQLGLDVMVCQRFEKTLANLSPEAFALLIKRAMPGLRGVFVGEGWRFGTKRSGTVDTLKELGRQYGFEAQAVPTLVESGERISSTLIRRHVLKGDMQKAAQLMGRPYMSLAPRIRGAQLGRKLGFPTVNMAWEPELEPFFGVYTGWASFQDREGHFPCVLNYGVRPTLDKDSSRSLLEAHILDPVFLKVPEGTLTRIEWTQFLRPEQKFPSLDALKAQLHIDTQKARSVLSQ